MKSFQDVRAKYEGAVDSICGKDESAQLLIWRMLENAFLLGQDDVLQVIFDDSKRKSLSDKDLQQWDIPRNSN